MKKGITRQIVVILALVATIAVNGLANALPLNDLTTGEISDRFHVYFVPAGYVFSIWGLIYLALAAYAVYQALPAQRENPRLRSIAELFALSCVANALWLILWHYEVFLLTLAAMLTLLLVLIVIYLRLGIGRTRVSAAENWLVHVPFSIYLGWITVATIANATTVLDYLGWDGWGVPQVWAVVMLVAGAGTASAMGLTRGDVAFMLVIVWAFVGIAVKHNTTPLVSTAAWATAALVAVMVIVSALVYKKPDEGQ
ncbi:MAG: tryptophan-rich sensory protein [Anaerolineae bacterium]|jgi:benzodiazapine receptor|nr:tryptophan-rich sensory protein [Anaerolineae bacterium]